jgi:hypothetical protein
MIPSITTQLSNEATAQITRYGTNATYTQNVDGVYDVTTGSVARTSTSTTVRVFETKSSYADITSPDLVSKKVITLLLAGSSITFLPLPGDTITYNSGSVQVENIEANWSGDSVAMWRIVCTRM